MLNKKLFSKRALLIVIVSVALFMQSSDAFAGHRFTRRICRPRYHRKVVTIPNNYMSISIGGLRFWYGDDNFRIGCARRHARKHARRCGDVSPHGYVGRSAQVVYIFK